jgi:hypothetical protein
MVGKVREWYMKNQHLQGCSPRLCWLRTDGLAPASKYWTYQSHVNDIGPISLVACYQQMFDFFYCFIGWLGRKTEYGPMDRTAGVLWIMSGALFWVQWLYPTSLMTHKGLLCVDRVRYVWSWTIHELSMGCMWRVGQIFSYRVYSRI